MALIVTGSLVICVSTISAMLIKRLGQVRFRICLLERSSEPADPPEGDEKWFPR